MAYNVAQKPSIDERGDGDSGDDKDEEEDDIESDDKRRKDEKEIDESEEDKDQDENNEDGENKKRTAYEENISRQTKRHRCGKGGKGFISLITTQENDGNHGTKELLEGHVIQVLEYLRSFYW